jgi:phage recombination protein Bet
MTATAVQVAPESFGYSPEELKIIKEQVARDLTDAEFRYFLYVASQKRLNPLKKQIYAVKRKDRRLNREVMTIQTGIEGYRIIADRTERYAPSDREPVWLEKDGKIERCTVWVKKLVGGAWHEVPGTVYWSEFVQRDREGNPTDFWRRMGHNQIAKCAEAHALRKAFPDDLGDIYTTDEMQQADNAVDVAPAKSDLPTPKRRSEKVAQLEAPREKAPDVLDQLNEPQDLAPALRASIEAARKGAAPVAVAHPPAQPSFTAEMVSADGAAPPLKGSRDCARCGHSSERHFHDGVDLRDCHDMPCDAPGCACIEFVEPEPQDEPRVNKKDMARIFAAARDGNHPESATKAWLYRTYNVQHSSELPASKVHEVVMRLANPTELP